MKSKKDKKKEKEKSNIKELQKAKRTESFCKHK